MPVQSVPIYEKDAWLNQYAKRFILKEESKEHPKRFLFLLRNGDIVPVQGDTPISRKHSIIIYYRKLQSKTIKMKINRRDDDA